MLETWLTQQTHQGALPDELFKQAEGFLLSKRIMLPGPSVLERLIVSICSTVHENILQILYLKLSPDLKQSIDQLLAVPEGDQRSYFHKLKEYPPSAKIFSLKSYLERYQKLEGTGIGEFDEKLIDPSFLNYLFKLTKNYSSKHLHRFKDHKRYAMMVCFMIETRKSLLDHLVKMNDQYLMDMCRHSKSSHEKKHRELRKRHKKAIDIILDVTHAVVGWPEETIPKKELLRNVSEERLKESMDDLHNFKYLEERGYGDLLLARYPSLRKYFIDFIRLPFAAESGSDALMKSIEIIRKLDSGEIKSLPQDVSTSFVPNELKYALYDTSGKINHNAWETGLALAIKDALRSGDLYLPQSKQHVSFWDLLLNDSSWTENKKKSFEELQQPQKNEVKDSLIHQFNKSTKQAAMRFKQDNFAEIQNGKLSLKRYDKAPIPESIIKLQNAIDASMPSIRIEKLLIEVDQLTGFSKHFSPIQQHGSRPKNFYNTLIAAIISQATNLGVVSMSASVNNISVDMLRHVIRYFIREETLKAASEQIVNHHHQLPLSSTHGTGTLSSSDAQRFKIRADSLLASYYPRYYGYYEKAIGIYTHVSDQYSVFSTKIISCSPREALYVLDGLLENNTILKIQAHTTDTHGYTEIVFALCHLLGFYFMPRIKDFKDQQLYRVEKSVNYGVFSPLLNKTADMNIIEEQWEAMIRVAISLKKRTAPAHVIVQRLTNSFPSDRLSKAFTNLGRIIKTEYILRYLTDSKL
jgi:TnpA family transposase